jgi:4-amino-4-deoxy-L-arabinose transferase-like glycosyltransferase
MSLEKPVLSQQTSRVRRLVPIEATPASLVKIFFALFAVFAAVVIVFPWHLTVELWDESIYANNAIEMAIRGHWLTPTYDWTVDHWNVKPPLMVWIFAALYKIGLPPMVALRLPSSLAALACVMAVFFFARKVLRRLFVGVVAALLMMSSSLYFGNHMAMNGDTDAVLCLFTTLFALGFFCFVEEIEPYTTKGIAIAGVALCGAIMTKGIAGVMLLPGLLVYVIIRRKLGMVVRDRRFWFAIAAAVVLTAVYYGGREMVDHGYLRAVWVNELGGRYGKTNEGHGGRMSFFVVYLIHHFEPGLVLTLLGVFSLLWKPRVETEVSDRSRAFAIFAAVVSLVFLAILSKSKTQIFYYCAPSVPLLSLLAAVGVGDVLRWWSARRGSSSSAGAAHDHSAETMDFTLQFVLFGLLAAITAIGLPATLHQKLHLTGDLEDQYRAAIHDVEQAQSKRGDHSPIVVVDMGFEDKAFPHFAPIADYYVKEAARRGVRVAFTQTVPVVEPGAWLLSCDPDTLTALRSVEQLNSGTASQSTCYYGPSGR